MENSASFVSDKDNFENTTLAGHLRQLMNEKQITRSDIVKNSSLSETYAWLIINGQRRPTRNKLLQICFAMTLTQDQANKLLTIGSVGALYAKNQRDAVLIYSLENKLTLFEADELLYNLSLETCS